MEKWKEKLVRRLYVELGWSINKIAQEYSFCYSRLWYFLKNGGLLRRENPYRFKCHSRFDYRDYMETVKIRCRKRLKVSEIQFKKMLLTKMGEDIIIQECTYYTPEIHMQIRGLADQPKVKKRRNHEP